MAEAYPAGRMLATPPHPQAHPSPQEYPLHYLSHQVGAPALDQIVSKIFCFQDVYLKQMLHDSIHSYVENKTAQLCGDGVVTLFTSVGVNSE